MADPEQKIQYDVPFDYRHFKKLADKGVSYSVKDAFTQIYQSNLWNSAASVSGSGSAAIQIEEIAKHLPRLIKNFKIKTLLDLPCGDFNWMRGIDLGVEQYIGGDIVEEIVLRNQQAYGDAAHRFVNLDLTHDPLPKTDLILCRDCLVHLSYDDIFRSFGNIKRSGITYLLTTTFVEHPRNHDIVSGDWRPLNLQREPFNLPEPVHIIDEKCTEGGGKFSDKSLGLWLV